MRIHATHVATPSHRRKKDFERQVPTADGQRHNVPYLMRHHSGAHSCVQVTTFIGIVTQSLKRVLRKTTVSPTWCAMTAAVMAVCRSFLLVSVIRSPCASTYLSANGPEPAN